MHAEKQNRRRRSSGKRLCAAFSTVAIAASTVGLAPASATVGPNGVQTGRNITVFHNIDMVVAGGWDLGVPIIVEVIRNGVSIGSATGPSVLGLEGVALEVNHGPEGTPQAGDCWTGHTPDILPGDTIRVTNSADPADVNDVIVDDINLIGPPVEDLLTGDIVVSGVARFADGTPMPLERLDSSEFRLGSDYRGGPHQHVSTGTNGEFEMRYQAPYELVDGRNRENLTEAQKKAALLDPAGGHMTGFGHVEAETPPPEGMLVEGLGDASGPALGCEASPAAQDAVTSTSNENQGFLNAADLAGTGEITVAGSAFDANNVRVTVTDSAADTIGPISVNTSSATGPSTWSTAIPKSDLAGLAQGQLIVSMVSERTAGEVSGVSRTLTMDTEAPAAPTADPAAGPHIGVQDVSLFAGPSDDIFYNLNAAADPTSATGTKFIPSSPVEVLDTSTLRAIAVDDAMNPSTALTAFYDITGQTPPGAPTLGATQGGDRRASAAWSPPGSDGFSPITFYKVTADGPGSLPDRSMTVLGDARAATLTDLENGTSYQLTVAAINAFGESVSSPSRAVTPATVPDAPEIGFARAGQGTASVTWLAPEDDNGADVTSYRLRVYRGPSLVRTVNMGLAPRASLTGLAYGANYRFAVEARNIMGYSALSARSNAVVPRSTPSKPRQVRGQSGAIGGRDTARVTWLVPATNRGSRITTYVVRAQRVRANGSIGPSRVVAVKPPRARSANLVLRSGTYRFKVRAINGVGRSPWSNLSNRAQAR